MGKKLFAGPFIGEFGMELFEWQGYLREIAKDYDEVIISSRSMYEFIYKDFCTKFIPYDTNSTNCDGYECIGHNNVPNIHEEYSPTRVIRVLDLKTHLNTFNKQMKQKFISYNKNIVKDKNICICARRFNEGVYTKRERNWNLKKCRETVDCILNMGYTVTSLGLRESSEYIDGTIDRMDIGIEMVSNILSSSKMIIGPSAGLMHFATLCECPQLVWGSDHLENRYINDWNPFNVKVKYLTENGWNPTPEKIIESVKFMESIN